MLNPIKIFSSDTVVLFNSFNWGIKSENKSKFLPHFFFKIPSSFFVRVFVGTFALSSLKCSDEKHFCQKTNSKPSRTNLKSWSILLLTYLIFLNKNVLYLVGLIYKSGKDFKKMNKETFLLFFPQSAFLTTLNFLTNFETHFWTSSHLHKKISLHNRFKNKKK